MNLSNEYIRLAKLATEQGIPNDPDPNGAIHQWIDQNIRYRPDTAFWIVFGISSAMADLQAQSEGYADALDRAIRKTFDRKMAQSPNPMTRRTKQ